MLTQLFQALLTHLLPLEMPLYLTDCVPTGNLFPYIAAQISPPFTPDAPGTLTLTLWCRGDAANADRLALTEELLRLLPARGICLRLPQHAAILTMKFPAVCVHSRDALGVRATWTLQCYPASPKEA